MATKHHCDLCGNPAMDSGFTCLTYKRPRQNRYGYHLNVEFTDASKGHPIMGDKRADICAGCMAGGLRVIASQIEQHTASTEDES